MKSLLIALILLFAVTSCLPKKKDKDIEPDLAGTYQLTRFKSGNTEYITPQSSITGSVVITRPSDSQIDITLNLKGSQSISRNLGKVDIKKASGKDYDIIESGTRIGSINGSTFSISGVDDDGDDLIITASK